MKFLEKLIFFLMLIKTKQQRIFELIENIFYKVSSSFMLNEQNRVAYLTWWECLLINVCNKFILLLKKYVNNCFYGINHVCEINPSSV